MYTGFWINKDYIYGPREAGKFWIDKGGYIYGPRNGGKFWIDKHGYIYGPKHGGKFWIEKDSIYGPDKDVPWLE